ncbi:MAG: NnrS family protein [Pseudoxanthomonas sp.]|nr:NnrS family protein [Pseudoxanthomonas sp.]
MPEHVDAVTVPVAGEPSLRRLLHAPHRLMFFIGAANLLVPMLWWAAWLGSKRFGSSALPEAAMYAGWLHAFVMQYQVLPCFMFGFLFTVFPRWTGQPDLRTWRYAGTGVGLVAGQACTLAAALGWQPGLALGLLLTAMAWIAGMATLGAVLMRETAKTWHARSCFLALAFGLAGLICQALFVTGGAPLWSFASIKLGTFGLLLPIYFTVAHRMFPFFAGNAVPGYKPWRPMWVLACAWFLLILHLAIELAHGYLWLWLADLPLLLLTAALVWRWWPGRGSARLVLVLFIGMAWLPVAFALYFAQSATYVVSGTFVLGRAPAHALFIGFFGSVLVAMVTRVSQGHSGRPLQFPAIAMFAFAAIQLVALTRIAAEFSHDMMLWQFAAALGWLVALGPWALRLASITVTARVDGKAG